MTKEKVVDIIKKLSRGRQGKSFKAGKDGVSRLKQAKSAGEKARGKKRRFERSAKKLLKSPEKALDKGKRE